MSEVVTKRLLTDETGQLLVTALNSIAASCKPDATEINMGPNDDTKVATQINSLSEQIVALQGKITDASKGTIDLNNYKSTGMYSYNGNTSSNAPSTGSSTLIVIKYSNDYVVQIVSVVRSTVTEMWVRNFYNGTTWSAWSQLATKSDINSTAAWPKFSDLTLSNCQAHDNVGAKYAKYLGFVVLQIYVKSLTANSRVKIATLPTGYKPLKEFTYVGQGGSSYTTKAYFSVADNGDIYVISEDTYAQGYIIFWAA